MTFSTRPSKPSSTGWLGSFTRTLPPLVSIGSDLGATDPSGSRLTGLPVQSTSTGSCPAAVAATAQSARLKMVLILQYYHKAEGSQNDYPLAVGAMVSSRNGQAAQSSGDTSGFNPPSRSG